MATAPDPREAERWRAMKAYRAMGMDWVEIVPLLIDAGLLECRNHTRTRVGHGVEICATCEGTTTQFWRRNIQRLSEDEADVLEVRFEWIEAHRFIARVCRQKYIRDVEITTERAEMVNGKEVKVLTTRRETRIDRGLLALLSQTLDKMAKVAGMDFDDPESLTPTPQGKIAINRPKRSNGDGSAVN